MKKDNFFVPYLTDAGYPIWWGEAPHIIYSMVESVSLRGCSAVGVYVENVIGVQYKWAKGLKY